MAYNRLGSQSCLSLCALGMISVACLISWFYRPSLKTPQDAIIPANSELVILPEASGVGRPRHRGKRGTSKSHNKSNAAFEFIHPQAPGGCQLPEHVDAPGPAHYVDHAAYCRYFRDVRNGVFAEYFVNVEQPRGHITSLFEDALDWHGMRIVPDKRLSLSGVSSSALTHEFAPLLICGTEHRKFQNVACENLGTLLRRSRLEYIDLFALSAAGYELEVLNTMNWTIPVAVFAVWMSKKSQASVKQRLLEHGYALPQDDYLVGGSWCDVNVAGAWQFFENPKIMRYDAAKRVVQSATYNCFRKPPAPSTLTIHNVVDEGVQHSLRDIHPRPARDCHIPAHTDTRVDYQIHHNLYCRYFRDGRKGVFVEVGARDGFSKSFTKFFEEALDWQGVLIEGRPGKSQLLMNPRAGRERSPLTCKLPLAICPKGHTNVKYFAMGGMDGMAASLPEFMAKKRARERHKKPVYVSCAPLSELLRLADVQSVDFFVLDGDGDALEMLKTMNWSIPVGVWVLELDGVDKDKDAIVRQVLREHGYKHPKAGYGSFCGRAGNNEFFENTRVVQYSA